MALGQFVLLWTPWCSDFDPDVGGVIPHNALQVDSHWPVLALSIPLLVAVGLLPPGRPWPALPAIAGLAVVLGVYFSRDPEPARNTFDFMYAWTKAPILAMALWVLLIAITAASWRSVGKPSERRLLAQRTVVFACGIGLLVTMAAGWAQITLVESSGSDIILETTPADHDPIASTGLSMLGQPNLESYALAGIVILMGLLLLLPAQQTITAFVAALGLVSTAAFMLLVLPKVRSMGSPEFAIDWLPAPYLALILWAAALTASWHARSRSRAGKP
ncbi:hypothetical protein EV644_106226 [Kribbella orskensis]|uniref:MYXO-CTERM domain-containing protein n=1 Tax=Kribbella orskensis TaxID=2512216 RepID=A0ABY2BK97_9ACTN|nr:MULTISPECIES: hypothetical protein [Kribbella]TCN40298.1 hypothetical protein EV642_105226 [Kribbella sp. VKM Ac-2500]TCO22918.1 hypothetical protein EV644_106226 [Kribbella orskensis]